MKLIISPKQTLKTAESLIADVGQLSATELVIPQALKLAGAFGVEAAITQALLSWVKVHPNGTARVSVPAARVDCTPESRVIYQSLLNLASLLVPKIVRNQMDERVSLQANNNLLKLFKAASKGQLKDILHGRSINLVCSSAAPVEFLQLLYSAPSFGKVRDTFQFQGIVARILDCCLGSKSESLSERQKKQIGELVYELFRNTDEHATKDLSGNELMGASFRAIQASLRVFPKNKLNEYCDDDLVLRSYFTRVLTRSKRSSPSHLNIPNPNAQFLEISVLDNGPGLARRYLSWERGRPITGWQEFSLEEEGAAVKKCFEKYQSTKETESGGLGLTRVVSLLTKLDSFLRVRTGRLCFYQAFSPIRSAASNSKQFDPKPWHSDQRLSPVEGLIYTICIPLLGHE